MLFLTNYECLGIQLQLSEHFTYPNTLRSQRVRITDFLLYIYCNVQHVCRACPPWYAKTAILPPLEQNPKCSPAHPPLYSDDVEELIDDEDRRLIDNALHQTMTDTVGLLCCSFTIEVYVCRMSSFASVFSIVSDTKKIE